jgi:hypothetical protein
MNEIKKLVKGWSERMGQLIGEFKDFDTEERILSRAIVSSLKRQLQKLDSREAWVQVEGAFRGLQAKLPSVTEGDISQLFNSPEFKSFVADVGFSEEELQEFDLMELVGELRRFITAGIVQQIFEGVIQLAQDCQRTFA